MKENGKVYRMIYVTIFLLHGLQEKMGMGQKSSRVLGYQLSNVLCSRNDSQVYITSQ